MSRPTEDRAIVDAGLKALAFDSGPPLVCDEPAATYERASHEHGRLGISGATNRLGLGDKLHLVPGHTTVNLYDWYVGVREGRVEQLWPITARCAVYRRSSLGHTGGRPTLSGAFLAAEPPSARSRRHRTRLNAHQVLVEQDGVMASDRDGEGI